MSTCKIRKFSETAPLAKSLGTAPGEPFCEPKFTSVTLKDNRSILVLARYNQSCCFFDLLAATHLVTAAATCDNR